MDGLNDRPQCKGRSPGPDPPSQFCARAMWDTLQQIHGVKREESHSDDAEGSTVTRSRRTRRLIRWQRTYGTYEPIFKSCVQTPHGRTLVMAVVIVSACQGREYEMAEFMPSMNDDLTTNFVVARLRSVETFRPGNQVSMHARDASAN